MNDNLARLVDQLNEPQPPPTLMATVMARVAQQADARASTAMPAAVSPQRDGALVTGLVASLVVLVGATAWTWLPAGSLLSLLSPRVLGGPAGLIAIGDPAALPFVVGLALYLFVLFSPLRPRRRA